MSDLDFLLVDDSPPIPAREVSLARAYGARPYQSEAVLSVEMGWDLEGVNAQLVCMATGSGKTPVISIAAQRTVERIVKHGGKVLVLAHTDELIDQAIAKIVKFSKLKPAKEKAENYASRFDKIVVGSIQTMCGNMRLLTWPKNHFALVIIDEAHRSLADSYQKVIKHFLAGGAKILGLTATADRGDKRSLGEIFQRVAYDYGLLQAVRDGWLIRPIVKTMHLVDKQGSETQIDLNDVAVKKTAIGSDFDAKQVGQRLVPFMAQIAAQVKKAAPNGKIVYFLPSVETAQLMCEAVRATGMTCACIHGETENRKEVLRKYRDGQTQAICNMQLLTEGWDLDTVDTLVILRPTKIRSLFVQMAGRACRPLDVIVKQLNAAANAFERHQIINASAKKVYTIIDFLWLYKRHDLVRPVSLVSEKRENVERVCRQDCDLIDMEEKAERDLLKALEAQVRKNANREARTIDPLAVATELGDVDLATYEPETERESRPVSEGQIIILKQNGVTVDKVQCHGHAQSLIGKILQRHAHGLCTMRQLNFMKKLKIEGGSHMTRDEATAAIDAKTGNN